MKVLITGAAGFIGGATSLELARRLSSEAPESTLVGIDNLNSYYDVSLKEARLARLRESKGFQFHRCDITDTVLIERLIAEHRFDAVLHFAAQAGVRHSFDHPQDYIDSNITGLLNLLQACRKYPVKHLVFASSSSVYGMNAQQPLSVSQPVDHPISFYAATKRSGELMAHSFSHLFGIPVTVLRFFTVYGPWGRPDMSPMKFASRILKGETIELFNHGRHRRDFTYIDDIVDGVLRVLPSPPSAGGGLESNTSPAPFRIYNLGNGKPVELLTYVGLLEKELGVKAKTKLVGPQPGDVENTWSDISETKRDFGYDPRISIDEGVRRFVEWFRHYTQ